MVTLEYKTTSTTTTNIFTETEYRYYCDTTYPSSTLEEFMDGVDDTPVHQQGNPQKGWRELKLFEKPQLHYQPQFIRHAGRAKCI